MIVFLDSNTYISAKYIFENNSLGTLKSLVKNKKVTVLYTSVTVGEVTQHIKNDIGDAITKYNRILRKDLSALCCENSYMLEELKTDKSINDVTNKFNNFLKGDYVEKISLNPIDIEDLMQDYFNQNLPFESKKPNEFKDAIMIKALKNYQKTNNIKMCIISKDEGFRKAFEGDEDFYTFIYISDFLKYYTAAEENLNYISDIISDEAADGMFDDIINDYINDFDIDRGYYAEWSIESGEIDEINYELLYIENLESKYIATFNVDVDISIDITYRDEDRSFYDKEDDVYLFEHFVHAIEKHKVKIEIAIECQVEKKDQITTVISKRILENKNQMYINLDEDTMRDSDELDDSIREDPDLVYCSQCGKLLGKIDCAEYFDSNDNPLCESCMYSDVAGEICPSCGRKVPQEYMMSGFCEDCTRNE